MPTGLENFRQQYPQYNDVPDDTLTESLYNKHYSDMPRAEFDQKMGAALAPSDLNNQMRSPEGVLKDRALAFESGMQTQQPGFMKPVAEGLTSRSGLIGAGATAGAMGTVPFAPAAGMFAPLVPIGGAIAGGALGSLGHELGSNVTRANQGLPPVHSDGPLGPSKRALEAGLTEGAWDAATGSVFRLARGLRKPISRILKLQNPEARRVLQEASEQGIELGPVHATRGKVAKGLARTMGVFPFVTIPLQKGQKRVVGQINDRATNLLNTLAPHHIDRLDLSTGMARAANARFKKFRNVSASFYEKFYKTADNLSVKEVVPTAGIKELLGEFDERAAKKAIEGVSPTKWPSNKFVDELRGLPDFITVEQAKGIQEELNNLGKKAFTTGEPFARLSTVANAARDAIHNLDVSRLPQEEATAVLRDLDKANSFYTTVKGWFETPAARRFGQVDQNIFEPGFFKAGNLNKDEIFTTVFNSKSADAAADLRKIVGPRQFDNSVDRFFKDAFEASKIEAKEGHVLPDLFSAANFEKRLGLESPEGVKVMEEMLKGKDLDVPTLQKFIRSAKEGTDVVIGDPSTFVMRRFILGAGLGGSIFAGAGQVSIPTAALITGMATVGGHRLMSNKALKSMTSIIDESVGQQAKRASIVRIMRMFPEAFPAEETQ